MPLDGVPAEDDILARIRTIQGVDVIEGEYTQDSWVPQIDENKMFTPYLLIKFNGGFPAYDNGICGPDKDMQRYTFSVFIVSPDDRTSRLFRDRVRTLMLTNFTPTDASTLRPGGSYSFIDSDLGYHRYVHNIGFSYNQNLS